MNTTVRLKQRPYGYTDDNTWTINEESIPSLSDNQFLVKINYISLDPAMRGWMDDAPSYLPPVKIGEVMRAGCTGEVVESNNSKFKVGATVTGWFGAQEYAVSDGEGVYDISAFGVPEEKFLGVLGMTGYTAFFGLLDVGQPKAGETLMVSGAAGAVGSIVGQIGKIKGLRVVGIAGGPEKCNYCVNELGIDACIDYKSMDFMKKLFEQTPKGVDVYFDNVGGDILDAILIRINKKARVVLCGAIAQYNNESGIVGPKNYLSLLVNRARMEGFIVLDYADKYDEATMQLAQWMQEGKIQSVEHIENGIANFPTVFNKLFSGEKMGKLILKVNK